MASFDADLELLSNLDWNGNYQSQLEKSMDDIVNNPYDFALYLRNAFFEDNKELLEQIKGILFFLVYRYPEIFILISMYLNQFHESKDKQIQNIIYVYSTFIKTEDDKFES